MKVITPENLIIDELKNNPIWQYYNDDRVEETAIRPVKRIPVKNLKGKLVATEVKLGNGNLVWALIGNVDVENPRFTEHFITISIEHNGKWFTLARYHDFDYSINGPDALANFLSLEVNQIFPISYDIIKYSKGDPASLSGQILKEPRERLTRAEIIAMAIP